jgi:hypothetical protein
MHAIAVFMLSYGCAILANGLFANFLEEQDLLRKDVAEVKRVLASAEIGCARNMAVMESLATPRKVVIACTPCTAQQRHHSRRYSVISAMTYH